MLIEGLLDWLAALPTPAVYLVLAALATLENLVPPVPADTAVALGAFLSHRGDITPLGVWLSTWIANTAGAAGVYYATRLYGRSILDGPIGRRLLSPGAVAAIEREYIRFGVAGIFLSRFLPGIRAVVPAFAGLVRLSVPRALLPMVVASGLWYGALTMAGAFIGSEWEAIKENVGRVNAILGILGAIVLVLVVWWVVRSTKQRRLRIWRRLEQAFEARAADPEATAAVADPALRAAAALVLDLAFADTVMTDEDRHLVETHLAERWDVASPGGGRPTESELARGGEQVQATYSPEERLALLERMHQAAILDSGLSAHEAWMMKRAAALLGVTDEELDGLKRRWRSAAGGGRGAAP